jgi:SAM-dependent methyltransferase
MNSTRVGDPRPSAEAPQALGRAAALARRLVNLLGRGAKLNIGPGKTWARDGWETLDYYHPHATYACDLRESPRLPLPSDSVELVFCSHVIEHLSDEAVLSLFREVARVLRYGGAFRVSCPDAEKAVAQFKRGNCDPRREIVTPAAQDVPSHLRLLNILASFRARKYRGRTNTRRGYSGGPVASKDTVSSHVAADSLEELGRWAVSLIPAYATYRAHINAHWPAKVERMLKEAGFTLVYRSKFRQSSVRELRGKAFDNRPNLSLFYEARVLTLPKLLGSVWLNLGHRALGIVRGLVSPQEPKRPSESSEADPFELDREA